MPVHVRCVRPALRFGGIKPSMGSVGDAYDNALCESFFATLECAHRPPPLRVASGGTHGRLRLHRGLLQPRVDVTLRSTTSRPSSMRGSTRSPRSERVNRPRDRGNFKSAHRLPRVVVLPPIHRVVRCSRADLLAPRGRRVRHDRPARHRRRDLCTQSTHRLVDVHAARSARWRCSMRFARVVRVSGHELRWAWCRRKQAIGRFVFRQLGDEQPGQLLG